MSALGGIMGGGANKRARADAARREGEARKVRQDANEDAGREQQKAERGRRGKRSKRGRAITMFDELKTKLGG